MKTLLLTLVCAADALPKFENAEVTNANIVTVPYLATEAVSYQCINNFAPNPVNAPLTCTCTADGPDSSASWRCDPSSASALATTCQPGKRSGAILFCFV